MKHKVILLCLLAILSGCVSTGNPRSDLVVSRDIFSVIVRSLATGIRAGKFTAAETDQILIAVREADRALDEWESAILAGAGNTMDWVGVFQRAIEKLLDYHERLGGEP